MLREAERRIMSDAAAATGVTARGYAIRHYDFTLMLLRSLMPPRFLREPC